MYLISISFYVFFFFKKGSSLDMGVGGGVILLVEKLINPFILQLISNLGVRTLDFSGRPSVASSKHTSHTNFANEILAEPSPSTCLW